MQQLEDIEIELSEPQTAVLASRQSAILNMSGQGGGKSQVIGYSAGMFLSDFPQALGFIGANTYMQLSQSTLVRVFATLKEVYGFTEYDKVGNPAGAYVVDKKPPPHFHRIHQLRTYDGTMSFYNGALVFLGSLDNYKAHDGKEFAWAHLDETKDTDKKALKDVILGRLRQYGLWYHKETKDVHFDASLNAQQAEDAGLVAWNPLYINTSPADGGVDWLNDMFKLTVFRKEIKKAVSHGDQSYFHKEFGRMAAIIYPVHFNAENLPPGFIDKQIEMLADDDKVLKLVNGYPFGKSGGEWYPRFREDKHVKRVPYVPGVAVHSTWDFNVVPYMTNLNGQITFENRYLDEVGTKYREPQPGFKFLEVMVIRIYKEYCFEPPLNSTDAVCEQFIADHGPETELFYYGDAHGLRRIPGMGAITNYKIIEEKLWRYLNNDSKKVKDPNVGVFKRRDLMNKIFGGQIPSIEIEIDEENCPQLVADCGLVKLGPKGKLKEKDSKTGVEKRGHPTDALEYLVSEVCKEFID